MAACSNDTINWWHQLCTHTPTHNDHHHHLPQSKPQVGAEDIKTLVEDLDAQPELQDQDGWTCLHWAAQQGRAAAAAAVFEALTSLASEPSAAADMVRDLQEVRDGAGKTAADVAREAELESGALEAFLAVLESGPGSGSS